MNKDINLSQLLLPTDVLNHFDIVDYLVSEQAINIYLDEKNTPPSPNGFSSKGFTEQKTIQDFPIRGKSVYLNIRRRKWVDTRTGNIVTSTYDLAHLGTQISQEFVAFLKGIHRK